MFICIYCCSCSVFKACATCNVIIIIIIIIITTTFMHGIYNYIPETNHVYTVYSVTAVLYLQSVLHVMLFRSWNMFCAFTLALPAVCVQCPILLFFAVPKFRAFPVSYSRTVWVILKCFQSSLLLPLSLCYRIPHALNFYYEVFIF